MIAAATVSHRWRAATLSPGSDYWWTPPALYHALDLEFHFTIDVAADASSAQVRPADPEAPVRYFDRDMDALRQSWSGERVFCNPPYGRELDRWVYKSYLEVALTEPTPPAELVVLVLPARTGNRWFHEHVLGKAEIRFIQGRLGFQRDGQPGGRSGRAPFDSMVVIYRPAGQAKPALLAQPMFPFLARG